MIPVGPHGPASNTFHGGHMPALVTVEITEDREVSLYPGVTFGPEHMPLLGEVAAAVKQAIAEEK